VKDPIRTFLVDDHPVVLAGARALIEASDDIICVGDASTGADALAKIEETAPDVVVLDVLLPDMSGFLLAEELIARGFRGHIVVMTLYENRSYVEQALQVGAKGFVQKRSAGLNLLLAIRSAMLGGLFFDPPTACEMLTPPEPETVDRRASAGEEELTAREEEVLRLIALGYSNKEIAYRVAVSVKSVETYKARATEKLNLHSRAQIVQFAVTHGWIPGPDADAARA
jgi:DNA-binding NarL/FixJ family response regulator